MTTFPIFSYRLIRMNRRGDGLLSWTDIMSLQLTENRGHAYKRSHQIYHKHHVVGHWWDRSLDHWAACYSKSLVIISAGTAYDYQKCCSLAILRFPNSILSIRFYQILMPGSRLGAAFFYCEQWSLCKEGQLIYHLFPRSHPGHFTENGLMRNRNGLHRSQLRSGKRHPLNFVYFYTMTSKSYCCVTIYI